MKPHLTHMRFATSARSHLHQQPIGKALGFEDWGSAPSCCMDTLTNELHADFCSEHGSLCNHGDVMLLLFGSYGNHFFIFTGSRSATSARTSTCRGRDVLQPLPVCTGNSGVLMDRCRAHRPPDDSSLLLFQSIPASRTRPGRLGQREYPTPK